MIKDIKYSVCISTFYDVDYLKLCVKGLCKNSIYPFELCLSVWDNDLEMLEYVNYLKNNILFSTKYFILDSNKLPGGAYGYNEVWKLPSCDTIIALHTDHVVCPEWDKIILPYFTGKEIVSFKTVEDFSEFGTDPKKFDFDKFNKIYTKYLKNTYTEPDCFWPFIVSKEMIKSVDGIDIRFDLGPMAENNLWTKLYEKYKVRFLKYNNAVAYHFSGSVTKTNKMFVQERQHFNDYEAHPLFESIHGKPWDLVRVEKIYVTDYPYERNIE